jgi:hypothetical protein
VPALLDHPSQLVGPERVVGGEDRHSAVHGVRV